MALASAPLGAEELDMNEYLFGHVGDSYEWHITTVKGHPVSIPLPVIVRSKTSGWHVFSSRHLEEGIHEGFYISSSEKNSGKIVERGPSGEEIRPLDLSITKNVAGLMFNSALLVLLVLLTARWYKKHDAREEAPKGFAGVMEMMITMVEYDIIKECI